MAAGKISQMLYLTNLPAGAEFTVTSVATPQNSTFYTYFNRTAPFEVNGTQAQPGLIGESVIMTQGVTDSGTPPPVTLYYNLQVPANGQTVTQSGYLILSTTDFGTIQRPDYSLLTLSLENEKPQTVSQRVPLGMAPDPIYIGFAVSNNHVILAASPQNMLSTQVLEGLIQGVSTLHQKMIGWVIGLLA